MRRTSRLTFPMYRIKVLNRDNDYLLGYAVDLSETGLRLLSDTLQEVDTRLPLRLKMRLTEDEMAVLDIDAICMWSRESKKKDFFESGFTLTKPSPEYSKLVQVLIAARDQIRAVSSRSANVDE
ncbi:PilZ domain-containing protein [Saccharophagus sp. K07]|uniref:PilZ domain-containing protein n=1 Tax=Saccharophagus sp. K07 TaxID=2283636 RepID=UPI0016525B6B|nr:PilZ domain-containing protein [Saccharophagus sp. K07]MBC6905091.1 PilZ domain-containing protein [Saccharophagus sp. K07]